ncbi:hypothetical protein EMIT0P265_10816 [Pseudomonas zeae]
MALLLKAALNSNRTLSCWNRRREQASSAALCSQLSKTYSQHEDFTGWPWRQGQTGNQPENHDDSQ